MFIKLQCEQTQEVWEFLHDRFVWYKTNGQRQVEIHLTNGEYIELWLENVNALSRFLISFRGALKNAPVADQSVSVKQYEPDVEETPESEDELQET